MPDALRKFLCFYVWGLALIVTTAAGPTWAANTQADLEARVAALEAEVHELQAQLAAQKARGSDAPSAQAMASSPSAPVPETGAVTAGTQGAETRPPLSWFGYGELNYNRPSDDPSQATFDLARFVLGAGYRFDERTRLQSELEIEHAVSSSSDPGEVEVEQAYIERELSDELRAQLGLFLIPSGLINENHEPTRFYGVFRNFVETAIIPTTWREGGVGLQGNTANGVRWNAGVTTGFDLSKWDPTSSEGANSPLGSIHQELALARAAELAGFLAANYTGLNGLRVGASVFSGGASQGQPGYHDNRVTLWEGHARWRSAAWDVAGLYAHGHITGTAPINLNYLSAITDPTLVPEDFFGWYLETAWRGRVGQSWPLVPFLRYERFNTGSGYATLPSGLTPPARATQTAITAGLQSEFAPGVILKTDYVDFIDGSTGDRFELGLGYEF
jgi:hypothetical protein